MGGSFALIKTVGNLGRGLAGLFVRRRDLKMCAKNSRGFTLTEVVIAALLMALAAGGLFAAFISANRWIQPETSRHNNIAFNIARARLEGMYDMVRGDMWDDTALNNAVNNGLNMTPHHAGETDHNPAGMQMNGVDYFRNYTVTYVDTNHDGIADENDDYRKVQATVSW